MPTRTLALLGTLALLAASVLACEENPPAQSCFGGCLCFTTQESCESADCTWSESQGCLNFSPSDAGAD